MDLMPRSYSETEAEMSAAALNKCPQ